MKKVLLAIGVFLLAGLLIGLGIGIKEWREAVKMKKVYPDISELENQGWATATFAGGCFWCMEPPFEQKEGVIAVISGYTGGTVERPSYEQVSHTETGHVEAVKVYYDPNVVSYQELLAIFWRQIDPTDAGGQFVDRGSSYTTAIFYANEEEQQLAEQSKAELEEAGFFPAPIVTPILPEKEFYPAEEYHQDYYEKNPVRYKYYRNASGRDEYLDKIWGEQK